MWCADSMLELHQLLIVGIVLGVVVAGVVAVRWVLLLGVIVTTFGFASSLAFVYGVWEHFTPGEK